MLIRSTKEYLVLVQFNARILQDDIGDKSVFMFNDLSEAEKERRLTELEQQRGGLSSRQE